MNAIYDRSPVSPRASDFRRTVTSGSLNPEMLALAASGGDSGRSIALIKLALHKLKRIGDHSALFRDSVEMMSLTLAVPLAAAENTCNWRLGSTGTQPVRAAMYSDCETLLDNKKLSN